MKYLTVAMVGVGLLVASALADDKAGAPAGAADLKDMRSKASYAIGVSIGRDLKKSGDEYDTDLISRGIKEAIAGKATLTDDEINETLQAFINEVYVKRQTNYLAENKKKPGVKTLALRERYAAWVNAHLEEL